MVSSPPWIKKDRMGTLESFLAPSEILTLVDQFPKHIQFPLGLDINVVVNTKGFN
jgi:hypothetical protein